MRKQDISYQDKLDELILDIKNLNSKGRIFILVEGESDIRLFRKFFNLDKCKVENIPGGNPKLEECVSELVKIYSLVFGIRDADFIHLGTVPYSKVNMFLTDFHDIEMTMIAEDEAISSLLFEYTDITKNNHTSIRSDIIKAIEQISYLKWLNEIEELQIKFKDSGFQDLISFANFEINFTEYLNRLLSKSPNAKIKDYHLIIDKINTLKKSSPNPFQLSNGHDFMKAFAEYIRKEGNDKSLDADKVSSGFRIFFKSEFFVNTLLYQNTKEWADKNNCSIYAQT